MLYRALYIVIIFLFSFTVYSQDTIVKKDNSKIIAKIIEVNPTEIKYKQPDNLDGLIYNIAKYEIAYVTYNNGIKEIYQQNDFQNKTYYSTNKRDSIIKSLKAKDYIKFNIQLGAVVNNNFSNVQRRQPSPSHTSSETYSVHNDNLYNYNLNLGLNFLFGRSPYIKHILGINYLHSRGEFEYHYYQGGYTSYQEDLTYISHIDYLNFVSGIQFSIGRHLKFEPQISINVDVHENEKVNGISKTTTVSGGPSPYIVSQQESIFKDKKLNERRNLHTISLTPKVSYEFKIKQNTFGVYFCYNLSYGYRLPWYTGGILLYPVKKYSPTINNKKIKIFTNIKLNSEIGITLNNSSTNLPESSSSFNNYDSFKSANKKTQTGYNLGVNIISGNNPYCKHIIGVSYVQSNAEFKRTSTNRYTEQDKLYQYRRDLNIKSTSHFFNIGTGIRLIFFKHINIDNSIVFNIPITSNIKYDGFEYLQEYTYFGTSNGGTYNQTNYTNQKINASNSVEKLYNYSIAFSPKISFDFNFKEQIFGLFFNFNYAFQQKIQWHMMGITYYPFKKLR